MQSDCKNYFGFVVEEFSGILRAQLPAGHFCLLETVTDSVVTQELRERGISVCTSSENVFTTNAK